MERLRNDALQTRDPQIAAGMGRKSGVPRIRYDEAIEAGVAGCMGGL
jgi:hypothetical protein